MGRHEVRTLAAAGAIVVASSSVPATARADVADVVHERSAYLDAHGDRPIASVAVEGLDRTRPGVVWQWIPCRVGEPLSRCDLPRIHEQLYRLAIFERVDVLLADEPAGVAITFVVAEKWTLYPVPMLWYSPDTQIAGAVLVEANLFGLNKGVALGGVYSNRGWYTLAGYNDPNVAFSSVWTSLHAFLGSGLLEDDRPDSTILQSADVTRLDVEWAVGTTLWDRVSPGITGALRTAQVGAVHVPGAVPATDATVTLQGVEVVYSDRRYRDLYDAGLRLHAEVQHAFPIQRGTAAYDDVILDAKWAHAIPLRGYLDARAHAFLGSSLPVVFEERLGGLDGSRTLPGSGLVAADRYASASLDVGVPFLMVAAGTATGVVFGEVGRYARNDEPATTYGGPGAGLRFFLRNVAVPAVGVDAGYEVGSSRVRFSISVGYRPVR